MALAKLHGVAGHVFVIMVMTIAAAEAAVGLAIVMDARLFCLGWRGVFDTESKMINSVMRGSFLNDANLRR